MKDTDETLKSDHAQRAKEHLGAGLGLGALSLGAAAMGAICPMCVIAVPALIGSGLYHRVKCQPQQEADDNSNEELMASGSKT